MKVFFLDTNIILDFLGNRKPFGKFALQIFSHGLTKEWELWTSRNSIITTYYILEKELGTVASKQKVGSLLRYMFIQTITKEDLAAAVVSKFRDYENGVQHACALSHGNIDAIITRNTQDFKISQIPVLAPEEVFDLQ
jgi:predicted nucleic acid-binding protein